MTITSSKVTAVALAMAAGADVAIQQLQSAGYTVSINWLEGHPNVSLRECSVTGISGLNGSTTSNGFETVYVDVSCPNAK